MNKLNFLNDLKIKDRALKLWSILKNNLGLKLLALAISFLIWFFVANNNDPIKSVTISNVPINIVNEDSIADIGKVVETVGNGTVTVKVTERRSIVNRLTRNGSNFYVEANMENMNAMNTVPLTVTCDSPQVSWDEIEIAPSSLKVNLQDKAERAFAVSVSVNGEPLDGLIVQNTELAKQRNVLIAGPESLVDIINQVTAPISVSTLSADAEVSTELKIFDKNGAVFTEAQMKRLEIKDSEGTVLEENKVSCQVSLWKIKREVPLEMGVVGNPAAGYYVKSVISLPSAVNLMGSEEAMENFGEVLYVPDIIDVTGKTESFTADVNLSDVLDQYDDVEFLTDSSQPVVSVEVAIERTDDQTIEIPLSQVVIANKPKDKKLVFTPADKIILMVHAEEEEIANLKAEEIEAQIDLGVCSETGTYAIPVQVKLPAGYSLSSEVAVKVYSMEETQADAQSETETEK